ncbi:unnamed protein product [Polarella glacialis]|nr:unnamed protein product [Polarella glacialis]
MVVLSTSTAELYERLWCVLEIACAEQKEVPTVAALSWMHGAATWASIGKAKITFSEINHPANSEGTLRKFLSVTTRNARCSCEADEKMITGLVTEMFQPANESDADPMLENQGTGTPNLKSSKTGTSETAFESLDEIIFRFRKKTFDHIGHELRKLVSGNDEERAIAIESFDDAAFEAFVAEDSFCIQYMPNPLPENAAIRALLKQEVTQTLKFVPASHVLKNGDSEDEEDLTIFYSMLEGLFKQLGRVTRVC